MNMLPPRPNVKYTKQFLWQMMCPIQPDSERNISAVPFFVGDYERPYIVMSTWRHMCGIGKDEANLFLDFS